MSLIKISVASLVFIWLVHYLFTFLKTTLTVPISKDMVGYPMQKYQRMFDAIHDETKYAKNHIDVDVVANNEMNDATSTLIDNLPTDTSTVDMRSELKSFLRGSLNTADTHTTPVLGHE